MIKFVQIEDNIFFANNVSQIITKIMMRKKDAYEIKHFKDYCPELKKLICEKEEQKIYILDIELPKKSGIDIAREIRNKGDYKSIIIFLTAHYELSMQVLENNLMILCFITKFNNFEEKLVNSINKSLNIVGKNKCLILEESNVLYRFNFEEIMYIIKDTVERKTIIRTKKTSSN